MLQNTKALYGHKLSATDGEIGQVVDFYFDDVSWVVRYLVADTGGWLSGRKVLLSPHAFGDWDRVGNILQVSLTRQQIKDSPPIETRKPVSRQYEIEYYNHYGWPTYWNGGAMWGAAGFPEAMPLAQEVMKFEPEHQRRDDVHLRSSKAVEGYSIHATDGDIGKVSGFMVDERSWAILQVVVEAGHWFDGKEIFIPVSGIERISYEDSKVFVNLTQAAIRDTKENQVVRAGN